MGGRIDDIAVDEKQPLHLLPRASPAAGCGRRPTTAPPSRRSSTSTASPRSVTSPSPRRTPTSSTSAPASRTTARARRSAAACTSPPTRGKTFEYIGLKETQSIARVVVHPKDPNTVYVAAIGHLFGPNKERGLYKTTDGGKTWTNTKFIDEHTGFTEVVMHPTNPNVLLGGVVSAAAPAVGLQRRRRRQRDLDDDRRREDLDEGDRQRSAGQPDHRPHRHGHLALEPERRSWRRSKSGRAAAPAPA